MFAKRGQGPTSLMAQNGGNMRFNRNIGMLLLALFLIIYGLVTLFNLSFTGVGIVMGLLALIAGIFILIGR